MCPDLCIEEYNINLTKLHHRQSLPKHQLTRAALRMQVRTCRPHLLLLKQQVLTSRNPARQRRYKVA